MIEPVLVAGATGGVGQQVVNKMLARGVQVRVLARDPERATALFGKQADIVPGDVRQPESLVSAMHGMRAVICTTGGNAQNPDNSPEHVDYEGVRNLVGAAMQAGVKHFVLVSTIAVTKPEHPLNRFGRILDWKLKGENALRESGLTYTIVRPGGLTNEPGDQHALQFDQGDRISGMISRADVAEVCIQALEQPAAQNVTLEVIQAPGSAPAVEDWGGMFSNLAPDSRG